MVNLSGVSPTAYLFMRVYISALRRDYEHLYAVLDLMDPDNLGVHDAVKATEMAIQMQQAHDDFEHALGELPSAAKFSRRLPLKGPSFETLSQLFSMSFFSVLYADKEKTDVKEKTDAGVFSGKPDEWHATLKAWQNNPLPFDGMFSACFAALSKLFPKFGGFSWPYVGEAKDAPVNFWPPSAPGSPDDEPVDHWSESDYEDDEDDDEY